MRAVITILESEVSYDIPQAVLLHFYLQHVLKQIEAIPVMKICQIYNWFSQPSHTNDTLRHNYEKKIKFKILPEILMASSV